MVGVPLPINFFFGELMKTLLAITLLLFSAERALAGYRLVQAPLPEDPMQMHIYQLDNGLTVYLTENHETPTFRSEITVRAGSKNDPQDATGLAHYLEHLLFKGSTKLGTLDWEKERPHIERITALYEEHFHEEDPQKRAAIYEQINQESQLAAQYAVPGEYDSLITAMGGSSVNAYTASDRTVYLAELPSNRLEEWAILESARFSDPVFRLFQPELEIVYEEKNRAMDSKDRLVYEALFELLYGKHPYGSQTALGSVEHLKRPSLEKIHAFFEEHYIANNMAVALSGAFEVEEAIEIVDRRFSSWRSGEVPEFDRPMPPALRQRRIASIQYPGEETVVLGFNTVPNRDEDEAALRLLDMILDNSKAGLINLNLTQAQRVAKAGASPYFRNDAGSQFLWGVPKEGQSLEQVETLLLQQLDALRAGRFEDWILPAILTDFKKAQKQALETNAGRLRVVSTSFGEGRPWQEVVNAIPEMEAVSKADIVAAAQRYFTGPYAVVYRRNGDYSPPKVPKPEFDPIKIDRSRQSAFAADLLSREVSPIEPHFIEKGVDFQVMLLASGAALYYVENPANDLFSLSKVFEVGDRELRELGLAAALLDKSGTSSLSPAALKEAWYRLGASFGLSVSPHSSSFTLSGLEENLDASLALFREALADSVSDEETLSELVGIQLKQKADAMQEPSVIFDALRNYARFGERSHFLTALSSEEIRALTVDDLLGAVKSLSEYEHDYFYVGTLPIETVAARLEALSPGNVSLRPVPERRELKVKEPRSDHISYVDYQTAQSQIRIEFSGGVFDPDSMPEVETFNEYFYGGMSGIVFQEMREARALAYSVWAYYLMSSYADGENLVMSFIGTQPDKTVDAISAFMDLWNEMPRSEDRFEIVRASLENKYRKSKTGFRDVLREVRAWERRGFQEDPRALTYQKVMDGSMEELFAFYASDIQNRPKIISVLGPSERIELEELAAFGEVQRLQVADLFVD